MPVLTSQIKLIDLEISCMNCVDCEEGPVKQATVQIDGVIDVKVSYEDGKAIISYDLEKVPKEKIVDAINATDYKIIGK